MLLQIEIDTLGKSYSTSLVYCCSEPTAAPEELKALMKLSEATLSQPSQRMRGTQNVCDVS